MTPKEKAKELVEEFYNDIYPVIGIKDGKTFKDYSKAKKGALKCVDELEKLADSVWEKLDYYHTVEHWQEVKQEIEKL